MSNYDDYITGTDKPFAENINDALLLSNVFDLSVPIQAPTMFRDSSWIDTTSRRKCGVAILTLKEALPSGVSISTVDGQSVLTGTGTVKLGFYPNFNSFGRFKSISWENVGTVQVNLKTVNNTTILSNISKGIIENPSGELRKLQEIVIEIILNNSTLKTIDIVMENKQQTRYGAKVGISDVTGLDDTITSIQGKDTQQDGRLNSLEGTVNELFDLVYPIGSIYMSVSNTSPSVLFGGTWERLENRFLLGATTQSEVGDTGGSATVTLTANQSGLKAHTHGMAHTHNHRHGLGDDWSKGSGSSTAYTKTSSRSTFTAYSSYDNTSSSKTNTDSNSSSSASEPHENMPPYMIVNIWERTA